MGAPWDYASSVYLNLTVKLADGSLATVKIDRYLNAGLPDWTRTLAAGREKDGLLGAIANELQVKGVPPLQFKILDVPINRLEVQRVFSGKGSPDNIRTVLWLASHFGRTGKSTIADYCNKYLGLDCNGFAGNFWGIDSTTSIKGYDISRRKSVAAVLSGDAMIFYKKGNDAPYHMGVVNEVRVHGKQFEAILAQSMGPEVGLHSHSFGMMPPQQNAAGDLYVNKDFGPLVGDTNMYFAEGPGKGKSNM